VNSGEETILSHKSITQNCGKANLEAEKIQFAIFQITIKGDSGKWSQIWNSM
jgi:hypothetical protein